MRRSILSVVSCLFLLASYGQSYEALFNELLNKLNAVKIASYKSETAFSIPGDTSSFNTTERYITTYANPLDTMIGVAFTSSPAETSSDLDFCYDGSYVLRFNWVDKCVRVDSLNSNPYRIPRAPFLVNVKSLLEYSLKNKKITDIKITQISRGQKISICFRGRIVEIMGLKLFEKVSEDKTSKYEIFINEEGIPYKLIRRMDYQVSIETCSKIDLSDQLDYQFKALDQIPVDFEMIGRQRRKPQALKLLGEPAPDWSLKMLNGKYLSLNELEDKVILLQFTGIGCGPCKASIPFMKELVKRYNNKDVEFISIETWTKSIKALQTYIRKNEIEYKYLLSNDKVKTSYMLDGVPGFFVLDKSKEIKMIMIGFQRGQTDREIIRTIDQLL